MSQDRGPAATGPDSVRPSGRLGNEFLHPRLPHEPSEGRARTRRHHREHHNRFHRFRLYTNRQKEERERSVTIDGTTKEPYTEK